MAGRDVVPAGRSQPLGSSLAVYEPATDAWSELPTFELSDQLWVDWAGPETLAVSTNRGLGLMTLDGQLRHLRR